MKPGNAYVLNASTSIEVGVGSGWDGAYGGAVDNLTVAFGKDVINSNFELAAMEVPDPGSMLLRAPDLAWSVSCAAAGPATARFPGA